MEKDYSANKYEGFLRYFHNTSWPLMEQSLRILTSLFIGIWVARYLGPENFGLYNYTIAFVTMFAVIGKLGLEGIIIRNLVNHPKKHDLILGTSFWLRFFGGIIVPILSIIALELIEKEYQTKILIIIFSFSTLFQSFEVIEFYFSSQVQNKIISICKITQLLFSAAIKILLILNNFDLIWFIVALIFDSITLNLAYIFSFGIKSTIKFIKNINFSYCKSLLRDSWPLIVSGFTLSLYSRFDQLMINQMMSNKDVGLYSAAVRIIESFYFIPVIISNSLFPAILNAKNTNIKKYYSRIQALYSLLFVIGFIIIIIISIFNNYIINFLFGENYNSSSEILSILIFCIVFVFFGTAWSKWMLAENLQQTTLVLHILSLIVNICMNVYLIPIYGAKGAAISTLISYSSGHIFFSFFFKSQRTAVRMFFMSMILKDLKIKSL